MDESLTTEERVFVIDGIVREGLRVMATKIKDNQKKLEERLLQLVDDRFTELETAVSSLREEVGNLRDMLDSREAGPSTSAFRPDLYEDVTPAKVARSSTPVREQFLPPLSLEDLGNTSLSKKLEVYVDEGVHDNERLTSVQLGFVKYYLDENPGASAKTADILQLIKAGTLAKMWTHTWKPAGVKADLFAYLKEKVKNLVRRRRVASNQSSFLEILKDDMQN